MHMMAKSQKLNHTTLLSLAGLTISKAMDAKICNIRGFNNDRKRGQDIANVVDTPRNLCSKSFWKSTKKVCYIFFFMFTPTIIIATDFM